MQHQFNESDLLILKSTPLFEEVTLTIALLDSILSKKAFFTKNTTILHEGADLKNLGIVLKGSAMAYKSDSAGKNLIMANLSSGSIFGGILSVSSAIKSPVTVSATTDVLVVFIPTDAIVYGKASKHDSENLMLRNLLNIISKKYFELHDRINCIIRPTLREKILFYLDNCAKEAGSDTFTIAFNRQALAQYLNAERSALSRELSKMKKEGLVDFYNESFRLVK